MSRRGKTGENAPSVNERAVWHIQQHSVKATIAAHEMLLMGLLGMHTSSRGLRTCVEMLAKNPQIHGDSKFFSAPPPPKLRRRRPNSRKNRVNARMRGSFFSLKKKRYRPFTKRVETSDFAACAPFFSFRAVARMKPDFPIPPDGKLGPLHAEPSVS